ncbi:MAG: WbqC family protein [Methanomicrobiales archaeon]|nr:WbqC family protein [Methanomicrobiales archaeon]
MIVSMHQPNFLPYLGFFQKMASAELFIFLDVVQLTEGGYTRRVRIRTREGSDWLSIPMSGGNRLVPIDQAVLLPDQRWRKKHRNLLTANYDQAPFFDREFVETYYARPFTGLREMNEVGIFYLMDRLGIRVKTVRASDLPVDRTLKSTDLLVDILSRAGADVFISGSTGRTYMDGKKFADAGIELQFLDFHPRVYPQRWPGFVPYLSAIDLVFNVSPEECRSMVAGRREAQTG